MTEENKQIEKELLEKEVQKNEGSHSLDVYAQVFQRYHSMGMRFFSDLSNKAKDRVLEMLLKFPLEDVNKKLTDQREKNAYNTLHEVLVSKFIMVIHSAGEEMKRQEDEKNKETLSEENKNV